MTVSARAQLIVGICVLVGLILFVFSPSLNNGFTNWDDPAYITENTDVQTLSWKNVRGFFLKSYVGMGGYTPLVLISYALEYHFYGANAGVFHRHNLILHIFNCLLVFLLIYLLCGDPLVCLITALLFAIHPLQVEPVAWIQGRKDLLFSFFYLISIIFYVFYRKNGKKRRYFYYSLLFFTLSLFSKTLAVSLPFVLLAFDYYLGTGINKKMLKNKLPYLILALIFIFFAIFSVTSADFSSFDFNKNIFHNLFLLFYAIVFYINQAILPLQLSARYSTAIPAIFPALLLSLALFSAIAFTFSRIQRKLPKESIFSLLFFCLALLPTMAFYLIGKPYADRYMYIPLIGMFFLAATWVAKAVTIGTHSFKTIKTPLLVTLVVVLVGFGIISRQRIDVWQNSISLWSDVIKHDSRSSTAYLNRGEAYLAEGRTELAFTDLQKALIINTNNPNIYNNLGLIYFKNKKYQEALKCYNRALQINPQFFRVFWNRGNLWGRMGFYQRAIADFSQALKLMPGQITLLYYRGITFKRIGDFNLAIADFDTILGLNPRYWKAYLERGLVYAAQGKYNPAVRDLKITIQLQPARIKPYEILRNLYQEMGKDEEAKRMTQKIRVVKARNPGRSQ